MANQTTKQAKTLSKKGLYAPLSISKGEQETVSNIRKQKIPPSLKDSALVDFLFDVGKDHNRSAKISVGKNNGCRPVSQNDVNERIRQRVLTLISGGIDSLISGGKTETGPPMAPQMCPNLANRGRKLRRQKQEFICRPKHGAASDKLMEINHKWNAYCHNFLREKGCDLQSTNSKGLNAAIACRMSEVGMIGSLIEIVACKSASHVVSKHGVVVEETANTWKIAMINSLTQKDKSTFCQYTILAKKGTVLTVSLPLSGCKKVLFITIN